MDRTVPCRLIRLLVDALVYTVELAFYEIVLVEAQSVVSDFILLQWKHGYSSSHLYFFSLHLSQARAARGRFCRLREISDCPVKIEETAMGGCPRSILWRLEVMQADLFLLKSFKFCLR
jgi:hypothetical protein